MRNRISTEIWFLLFVWNSASHPMVFWHGVNRISVLSIKFSRGLKNLQFYEIFPGGFLNFINFFLMYKFKIVFIFLNFSQRIL